MSDSAPPPQIPGYAETMRLVSLFGRQGNIFRPAWSSLELITVGDAEDFILPKLQEALGGVAPGETLKLDDAMLKKLIGVVLGFGVMAVMAEREESEKTYVLRKPETEKPPPGDVRW